jgi:hypothetical protein
MNGIEEQASEGNAVALFFVHVHMCCWQYEKGNIVV